MRRKTRNRTGLQLRGFACAGLFLAFLLTIVSCSTEKAKWTNIRYHNTTCHYNVWWNGNESLKLGREKIYKAAVDDYTTFLQPENLGSMEVAQSANPEMDRAIEKGVKGIKKHSIFVGGEEHVPYIKECYLLTAYATFYKQDFVSTTNTCNILTTQFRGTHAGDEGAILLARCLIRERRFIEAEQALDQLVVDLERGNFSRSQRDKLYLAMVEATVPQEKYKKAVEYIHLAIDATHSRRTKARLTFLMAQIYQKLDKRAVASKYYHQVLSYGPEYVMEFNARLGEASCADLAHSDIAKLEKQLDAMLRDKKNEEYRDQIYYAKGEMFLGVSETGKACENFRRSVALARANKAQKAKSALRLGEVLYDIYQDYDQAQLYYDTAIRCIDRLYPGYPAIRRRSDMLTELASFTRVYTRCDSLIALAAMPEAERIAFINAKIDTLKAQEQRAKDRALEEELRNETLAQQNTLTGDWYFYNQNTVQKGKETFRQRWGMRTLEDNWFLANKTTMLVLEDLPEDDSDSTDYASDTAAADTLRTPSSAAASKYGNPEDPHAVAFYLKDIPTTQRQLDSIDSLTSLSLLGAGYIFYDGLRNETRALECYLRLANDYTAHPEIVQAFYMLYRIYDRQGNTPQANYYRDMVLLGFPDSDFANLIRDNEYYKELLRRDRRIEDDYETLYTAFAQRDYRTAIALADEAREVYQDNSVLRKFDYWKALALVHTGNRQQAVETLKGIVNTPPRTDSIVPLAQIQLDLLLNDTTENGEWIADDGKTIAQSGKTGQVSQPDNQSSDQSATASDDTPLPKGARLFRYRENQQHYVIIIVNDRTIRATDLQYRIADFNTQYYANSGYKANAVLFSDTTQLITIHRFLSASEAMGYYRHLLQPESPLLKYPASDYRLFVISTQNYATFYNRKDPDAYDAFFKRYYLGNKQ